MPDSAGIEYINSTDYSILEQKLRDLVTVIDDNTNKVVAARKLRFADVDIEAEREEGRLQPDELYIPQHIIDTNIRREQSPYVQYVTQSTRAVICEDQDNLSTDLSLLEKDLTKKLRFDGWQLSQFSNIDGFQEMGYSIMEVVLDVNSPGGVSHEAVQFGDFSFLNDTKDIQACEMVTRAYYFSKTRLLSLCGDPLNPSDSDWDRNQVDRILDSSPDTANNSTQQEVDTSARSLFRIYKCMFRVNGIVNVAWFLPHICDNWIRKPRKLYIGRRKLSQPAQQPIGAQLQPSSANQQPSSEQEYETQYPYFLYPYLISENDTISMLRGRVYFDQDLQEAVSSLLSSVCTQSRRAAGLYGCRDTADPNADLLMQENLILRSGSILNSKVSFTQLQAPDPSVFTAINSLVSMNQNETSQVNFAVNNRKDSRKTAKEIQVASQQATILSTVQVVLFSLALKAMYTCMCSVITSRVNTGLITVQSDVAPLYQKKFTVKPSGDSDVIEKQQLVQAMMQAWPIMSQTPASTLFLSDMIELVFPLNAQKYIAAIQQAQQQNQSQQAQMMQQGLQMVKQLTAGIVKLSQHPDYFSDTGRIHAFPVVEHSADMIKQIQQQMGLDEHGNPKQSTQKKQPKMMGM